MSNDQFYMELALQNAKAMKGQTDPNPLVGAVIVNNQRIVGIGAHMKAGEPHAEIHALNMAGDQAKGATIYVTLEPCSHHGRTGPCAEALVQAGIKKCVIASLDPNPIVSGNGVRILEKAGIEVIIGVCEQAAIEMNEVFNHYITADRPFITLKSGISLDGKIATHTASSKWITSEEARLDVHQLRSNHQAILVGIGTVLHDDPALTSRIQNGRNPIRLVLDSTLRIPMESQLVNDGLAPTWIFTGSYYDQEKKAQLEEKGIRLFHTSTEKVTIAEVMTMLKEEQISSVLIEGGGNVSASFLEDGYIDKVVIYLGPKLVGGKEAPTFLEGTGVALMSEAVELEHVTVTPIGKDFKFVGYPTNK
ncbi:bifunctional diaminohydroxyphosphoribosylaminopyrimidine deaminase/5-amino-6-(5-phosphoribosylamino)uracil reductase RibD [Cytobacillus kochii]|uniref:bifunctional diaminohydroxyphosphoribosylaminopyrimidine deaminase/5-amino-6-(5-phosphoribosylamino)uracil reductase RibD n=1 Tax=Cytobacillus kochii TaxID=859143 RepID=UPI001CD68791|nr:bifunctional diaminohydroxyphosphoribosylaminopyrimidine deaminase/5-amino-6-(5-phosphoribosylamino)uracil reductase RibD [Cytobacillus kochii]MCA1027986.1 bifunctional diaminohydroxyphosphoribosylaminopyrimidine deaminase/5-amino-6-(5-phosphoribosylamino)uracil reductase RibD [Cytobacillus kochii]